MTSTGPTSPMARSLLRRHATKPGRVAMFGSFLLHAGIITFVLVAAKMPLREDEIRQFQTIRIAVFSPPPKVAGEPTPPENKPAIVKRPKAPEPPAAKAPAKKAVPTPAPAKPQEEKKPTAGRNPDPKSVGGEGINMLQEGEEFPYPEYLQNVVRQINYYFRPVGEGNLEAEIGFFIRRDGSVSRLRVYRRSGNSMFDIQALQAVEVAGQRKVFGALPRDFPRDSLGILFRFVPPK